MWYELLINGYTWFTNQSEYSPNIKLAESVGGELNEGHYTRNEASQIRTQLNDYQTLGFNPQLKHLNRTGIHKVNNQIPYIPNKKYYVVGARNAHDVVPVGLFLSRDDAHGCFPLSNPDIIREATTQEIKDYFKLNKL